MNSRRGSEVAHGCLLIIYTGSKNTAKVVAPLGIFQQQQSIIFMHSTLLG
jgi:hypothetical protein